jgi:large subunit ribosomal protein L10
MAISKEKKKEIIKNLTNNIKKAKSIVFANLEGLKVNDSNNLRQRCKESDVECFMSKKTLLNLAFDKLDKQALDPAVFSNSVAVLISEENISEPAKIIKKYKKEFNFIDLYGSYLPDNEEGEKFLDKQKTMALADLPSREELLGRFVGAINAPLSGFVNVLSGNIRNLVNTIKAIQDKKV